MNAPDSVTLLKHTDRFKTVKTQPWRQQGGQNHTHDDWEQA